MPPAPTTHPSRQELAAFSLGKLTGAAADTVAQHLEDCETCRQAVASTTPDSFVGLVRAAKPENTAAPAGANPSPPDVPPELAEHPRFRIVRELGRGGMGVVYLAEHRLMERPVAIKVISRSVLDNPDALARFRGEVKAAARLQHPNIVVAYDAEQAGELHMLVMEYVEGTDLAKVLEKKGPLPVAYACHFVRQAALGLQHASEQGMVHRDIKPQNLMLTPKGQVKILDFGLARLVREKRLGPGLTAEDALMGTPEYLAPEQALDAHQADVRADIYSLGCTLYCLLAGQPPFAEGSAMQKIMAHLDRQARPLPEVRPEVSAALWVVVQRMLAKDPAARFQQPVEVAQALVPFIKAGAKAKPAGEPGTPGGASSAVRTETPHVALSRSETLGSMPNAAAVPPVAAPVQGSKAAAEVFAELAAPRERTAPPSRPRAKAAPRARLPRWVWLASGAGAAVLALALGIILTIRTDKGTVEIRISDPAAKVEVQVDGDIIHLSEGGKHVQLKVGEHDLLVKGEGFETLTKTFTVKRGENPILTVELQPLSRPVPGTTPAPLDCTGESGVSAEVVKEAQAAWAKYLGQQVEEEDEIAPGVKMAFVLVPPGRFLMGSPDSETDRSKDETLREVTLTQPFYLGKYPVTQAQYEAVTGQNPSHFKGTDLPVETVDWEQADAFAQKLSGKGQLKHLYRLPTEAEWEYACRGGRPSSQPFGIGDGRSLSSTQANFDGNFPYGGAAKGPYLKQTTPVGKYGLANALGLHDMHGNVYQWCADGYGDYPSGPVTDPKGPATAWARGGGWISYARCCRAAFRSRYTPALRNSNLGFRVARVPMGKKVVANGQVEHRVAKANEAWLKSVAGLAPAKQVEAVAQKLRDLNAGFEGQVTPKVEDGVVTELQFVTDHVTDISPVRALTGLRALQCPGSHLGLGQLADLSPLKDMKLTSLNCGKTRVSDLAPLKGMRLTGLECRDTWVSDLSPLEGMSLTWLSVRGCGQVHDLTPLKGMPLTALYCDHTRVSDLAPLKGMKLTGLLCGGTPVSDLSPLKGMPLTSLGCADTRVADLSPLQGMKLLTLWCGNTKVSDLSPLKGMPLKRVFCDFRPERDADILRSITTLERINNTPAAQVWKELDATLPPGKK